MKSQPWDLNQLSLASRSEVVFIYKCPPKFRAYPQNLGLKNVWPLFRDFRTRHRISPERRIDKQKC